MGLARFGAAVHQRQLIRGLECWGLCKNEYRGRGRLSDWVASSPQPAPPKEEREIESSKDARDIESSAGGRCQNAPAEPAGRTEARRRPDNVVRKRLQMRNNPVMAARAIALAMLLGLAAALAPQPCPGAGVTVITHGLNGNVDGWITGMADQIPNYYRFPGTNFTCYEPSFYYSGGYYYLTNSRVCGSQPLAPESGEIIVKLD